MTSKTKKFLISLLLPLFIVIGFSSNSFGSNPPSSFMNLPVSYFYPNGAELIANKDGLEVTVSELIKYGFKPGNQLWEELETNQYAFTHIRQDKFTGATTTLKILFVAKNERGVSRALMSQCMLNGQELTIRTGLVEILQGSTYGAYDNKKQAENPNYVEDKRKQETERITRELTQLYESSTYNKPIKSTLGEELAASRSGNGRDNKIIADENMPVMFGGDEDFDACSSIGKVQGLDVNGFLAVRQGAGSKYIMIDRLHNGDEVIFCDSKDKWIGIVYGENCGTSSIIAERIPYKGSCKSGWVSEKWVIVTAG